MKIKAHYLNLCIFLALMLCGFALYFVPLHSTSFYFDDRTAITNNEAIRHIDMPRIFKTFNTRTLVGLSFALNYKWGSLNPIGYRLVNLLIHCLNAFLVYLLAKFICHPERSEGSKWPAFFASLLFLCHPIQTEAVNSITQRFVLMGTFFYLASLYLYIKGKKFYYICSLITSLAAMFCKEFTVTLPIMMSLYDLYFLRWNGPGHSIKSDQVRSIKRILPFFAIALIVPILLLKTPQEANGAANIVNSNLTQHHIDITKAKGSISRKEYFLTELNVVCTYVRLLVFPVNQNFDYDYPLSRHLDGRTLLSGFLLLCLLILAVATYRSYRIISFSILWFFIALSVESSFIPIGHVIAEYRLYLASIGFIFLVTHLIYSIKIDQKKLNMIAAAVLIGFSILTFQRNGIWKDEFTLWNDTIQKSPQKPRAYNNRGLEYYRRGNFTQAIADFDRAIELNPHYAAAYNNRGVLYALKNNLPQAISDFNKAIEIDPKYADAYKNRALSYSQLKKQSNL